jgi:hypothetical protein
MKYCFHSIYKYAYNFNEVFYVRFLFSFSGSAVGLIFPEGADDSVYELLEDILQGIVTRSPGRVKRFAQQGDEGYSSSIALGIVTGNIKVYPNIVILHKICCHGDCFS